MLGRRWLTTAVLAAVVLTYGWWFTDRTPFSGGALAAWAAAVVVLVVAVEARRRSHPPRVEPRVTTAGVVVWTVLAVAGAVWELLALHGSPRAAHPTMSSLAETAEQWHVVRLAFYAAWVSFAWVVIA